MSADFHVIIPARYQSTRFPGKLLMDLGGQTVLERVYRQALLACPKSVIIATDHADIHTQALSWGADVVMTCPSHQTGTDRIAEVINILGFLPDEKIVNVQGDEPLISPQLIQQVAQDACLKEASMATLCWPLASLEEYHNPHVVKVVRNCHDHALYFSRSPIPACRDSEINLKQVFRHIGIYAYRAQFLLDYVQWPVCELEATEALEQLRILWMGYKIHVAEAIVEPLQDINTAEDLHRARCFLEKFSTN
jgi:3-deoxy-manno-octulosonate cytidylyltransferase (CMP-KDO synthetase)